MATQTSRSDDVVLQRPEDVRVVLSLTHSTTACAGTVTAYVLRRICYRAGAYAPGIQEHLFHELTTRMGRSVDVVNGWLQSRSGDLQEIGYRVQFRRIAERTSDVLGWVKEGKGFRGAVLATNYRKLYGPAAGNEDMDHAVGLAVDRTEPSAAEDVVLIEPWPGIGKPDRIAVPPTLESAQRDRNFAGIILYWAGWS